MKTIPLTRGLDAIVDDEDYERLASQHWHAAINRVAGIRYYAVSKRQRMHRVILNAPNGVFVDHINGNTLDNRRVNLRLCTCSQNQANSVTRKGTSRYKGVSWCKEKQSWRTQIRFQGKKMHVGLFADEEDAAIAYDVAAQIFFGEFARINDV